MTERLAARGIDPEASCEAWIEAILAGAFPIYANGMPRGQRDHLLWVHNRGRGLSLQPLPLAVVMPEP